MEGADEQVFVLTRREYAEILGSAIAIRRLGEELEQLYAASLGPHDDAARGARTLAVTADRIIDILRYDGER